MRKLNILIYQDEFRAWVHFCFMSSIASFFNGIFNAFESLIYLSNDCSFSSSYSIKVMKIHDRAPFIDNNFSSYETWHQNQIQYKKQKKTSTTIHLSHLVNNEKRKKIQFPWKPMTSSIISHILFRIESFFSVIQYVSYP